MTVTTLVAVALALSGGASCGYVLAGLLAAGRLRDLEIAYLKLSRAIHEFLGDAPDGMAGMMVLGDQEVHGIRQTLSETDSMAGIWTIEDYRR